MGRLIAVVMMFLLTALPFTTPAPAAAQESDPQVIVGSIDSYWQTAFTDRGLSYQSPSIKAVWDSTPTVCGWITPDSFGPAMYCAGSRTIYLSPVWFGPATNPGHWNVVLAHEWAHHVENLLGFPDEASVDSELRSDCLAGAYVGAATEIGMADASTFFWGLRDSLIFGDPVWLDDAEMSHETGAHRAEAFSDGYRNGPSACNLGW